MKSSFLIMLPVNVILTAVLGLAGIAVLDQRLGLLLDILEIEVSTFL